MNRTSNIILTCAKVLALAGLIAHILAILWFLWMWDLVPGTVPSHYDLSGNVNAYGSKTDLLILSVVLLAINFIIFFVLGWLGNNPQKLNYPWEINESNKEYQYRMASLFVHILRLESIWLFTLISLDITYSTINNGAQLFSMLWVILGSVLISKFTIIGWFFCGNRH